MKRIELVYLNKNRIALFENNNSKVLTGNEKKDYFNNLKSLFTKKEINSRYFSLFIGAFLLLIALVLAMLMILNVINLGSSQWFTYTFILAGLVVLWVAFYYLFGFIFYSTIKIDFYFKDKAERNYLRYASSSYFKYINNFKQYLGLSKFVINNNPKKEVTFGLRYPQILKNIIYNGHIKSNVPYFYLNKDGKHILFLPGFVVFTSKKGIELVMNDEITVKTIDNRYQLFNKDNLLIEFDCLGSFDINFFYFNY